MRLFLGVDGGQSSTTALIGDENGRVIGHGEGGPSNHVGADEGRARLTDAVMACVGGACRLAGLDFSRVVFAGACLGFTAGPGDKLAILSELIPAGRLSVTDDATIALAGALDGQPGMVVVAGTGSIALGRNAAGDLARAGGWGYLFGDEGAAFDLARQAVRAALRFEEGWGPPTSLGGLLQEATGLADIRSVQRQFYTKHFPRHRIASYAPLVTRAAEAGDEVARDVLENAAASLAHLCTVVRKRLFTPEQIVLCATVGGVFESALLRESFRARMEAIHVVVQTPKHGPAAGALIEAYRLEGLTPTLTEVPAEY